MIKLFYDMFLIEGKIRIFLELTYLEILSQWDITFIFVRVLCHTIFVILFQRSTSGTNDFEMKYTLSFLSFLLAELFFLNIHTFGQNPVTLGIFTDNQYCNCEVTGIRDYPASLAKLDSVIRFFNTSKVDAIFHLGDMIDHDFTSYDSVIPRYCKSSIPVNFVLGNHDFSVRKKLRKKILPMLGLSTGFYSKIIGNWEFIILNGDDLSLMCPQKKSQKQERDALLAELVSSMRKNFMPWNGGISQSQMNWLDQQLQEAQCKGRNVIVLCHFPVYPYNAYNLWNDRELIVLLTRYSCVKAYFNGHHHSGNYGFYKGIHFVNFKGMVNTPESAYAMITLTSDSIIIKGFGREPDRRLLLH
ncbi:MAG: metallophosphoesterase [Bacteroidales bacterium]|nr:metallophosphoesterase [Bacteroidales bacterium]